MNKYKYIVYFGVDEKPCEKDIAVKTNDIRHARTILNHLRYLNFNNAYILEKEIEL